MIHACSLTVSKALNFGALVVRRSSNLGLNLSCKFSVRSIRMENSDNCTMMSANNKPRGALVVFEGLDRSGKTSQCGRLLSYLEGLGHSVELWRFPDRTTSVGQMISAYLTNKSQLDDHTIHLLFSANRWEKRFVLKLMHYIVYCLQQSMLVRKLHLLFVLVIVLSKMIISWFHVLTYCISQQVPVFEIFWPSD
ncbi:hypothetical protein DITRI_Ditri11bG0016800 [Diplodiscus trichospermus]